MTAPRIAVLVPCYNEEVAIGKVVADFKATLPAARIYVYDNNSKDRTSEVAAAAGAIVRKETIQGKGAVVRRMFADIEADIYVLVDGDDTYEAAAAPSLISALLEHRLDMVNGKRITDIQAAFRSGHRFGNWLLTLLFGLVFGNRLSDLLSGYRVFSRRFVKSFPALATGFEIETELTVHALALRMPVEEVETVYKDRPAGSVSKLSTYKDGVRILWTMFILAKEERPLVVFSAVGTLLVLIALLAGWPVVSEYLHTGLVPRLPTALLATGLMILGFLSYTAGLILDTVTRGRLETKRLTYLRFPAPGEDAGMRAP